MDISIVGAGYVGLVAAACFAESGNEVLCVDVDGAKIDALRRGKVPIYEPGLDDIIQRNVKVGRLKFSTLLKEAIEFGAIIFIAVGTPQDEDGSADLTHVLEVAREIGTRMGAPKTVVIKSTVPVGTAKLVSKTISGLSSYPVDIVSNPEFLKEGAAIDDFMRPDRIVIGTAKKEAADIMRDLYSPFVRTNNPIIVMDNVSAEMTKYAANTMLATRVSLMNEMANLCDRLGADINMVRLGIGSDSRIGMNYLFPGIGYGGSCFPKDVQALIRIGRDIGVPLQIPTAVEAVNARQKSVLIDKIVQYFGDHDLSDKVFAIWGLAFKARTDDVREAPSLVVCGTLLQLGARLQAFDPVAIETFNAKFGDNPRIIYTASNYEALKGADALIVCTEWNEFRRPNWGRMKSLMRAPLIFDGRNIYEPNIMRLEGFEYRSIGRGMSEV